MNFDELNSQQFFNRPNVHTSSSLSYFVQSYLCMCLHPPASLLYHVYVVKGLKLNQRRILQVTRLWLRLSVRKGRVETKESKRRYATVVLPGLLNGKSERLPRVGSEDRPSPITNSCKSNSSHGYCRDYQLDMIDEG